MARVLRQAGGLKQLVRDISTLKHLQLMFNSSAIPHTDSAVNALTPRFAGDGIAPSSASTASATLACDPLESHLRQIHIFLDSHMHNVKSLQDSIVAALTESSDGVVSPSGGSVLAEAEPLLPSLVPDIQQIPLSGGYLLIYFHSIAY